jgi:hypothetical protein
VRDRFISKFWSAKCRLQQSLLVFALPPLEWLLLVTFCSLNGGFFPLTMVATAIAISLRLILLTILGREFCGCSDNFHSPARNLRDGANRNEDSKCNPDTPKVWYDNLMTTNILVVKMRACQ